MSDLEYSKQRRYLDPMGDWSIDRYLFNGEWRYFINQYDGYSTWDLSQYRLPPSFGPLLWNLTGVANYDPKPESAVSDVALDQDTDREQAERDDNTETWKNEIAAKGGVE